MVIAIILCCAFFKKFYLPTSCGLKDVLEHILALTHSLTNSAPHTMAAERRMKSQKKRQIVNEIDSMRVYLRAECMRVNVRAECHTYHGL